MRICPTCQTEFEDNYKFCPADGYKLITSVVGLSKDRFALATCLHNQLCRMNHDDACGWGWERNLWSGAAHQRWLGRADNFIEAADRIIRTCHGSAHEIEAVLEEILKVVKIF